jgi:hypothetical protein
LLVKSDGSAYLFYGALPQSQEIKPNTFDIDDLFGDLQEKLNPVLPAENRPLGADYGMVQIGFQDGSEKDYLIYDGAFAAPRAGHGVHPAASDGGTIYASTT